MYLLFYVHISIFSALPRTSACLPCPGKKCFLLQNIVQKSPPGVSRCTLLLPQHVFTLPPRLACFFRFIPVAFRTWGGSILLHRFPGSPAQPGRCVGTAAMWWAREGSGSIAPALSGGWRSPWDGWAALALDVAGAKSGVMGWLRLLLAALPGWGSPASSWKTAKSSGSGCRDGARYLKCGVKSFSQSSGMLLT